MWYIVGNTQWHLFVLSEYQYEKKESSEHNVLDDFCIKLEIYIIQASSLNRNKKNIIHEISETQKLKLYAQLIFNVLFQAYNRIFKIKQILPI